MRTYPLSKRSVEYQPGCEGTEYEHQGFSVLPIWEKVQAHMVQGLGEGWFDDLLTELAADLLFAFYQGARLRLEPGSLGAGFYIVTAIVPPLLVSHALIFGLLLQL